MSRSPRVLGLALAGALALAAVPSSAAAHPPLAPVGHGSTGGVLEARASASSNVWFGSGANCVGTAVTLSVGRQFGLAPGAYFTWRSRLYVYNPRTHVRGYTHWSRLFYDQVPTQTYVTPDGTLMLGAPGGVNPAPAPTSVWTVNHGWWVTPYVHVTGVGTRPVNFAYVPGPDRFAQPNWCYVA
jgi:hypothetical protein